MIIQLQCRSTIIRNKSFISLSYTYLHQNNYSIAAENTWIRCLARCCNLCLVPVVVTVWWSVPPWMCACWYCLYQPKILILGLWWCGWERSPLRTLVVETELKAEFKGVHVWRTTFTDNWYNVNIMIRVSVEYRYAQQLQAEACSSKARPWQWRRW